MSQSNILRVYEASDRIDRAEGMKAYPNYRTTLGRLAALYQFEPAAVVGAFCALSPNNDYAGNLRSLVTILHGYNEGIPAERLTVSTYNACKFRAWKCLHGEDFLSFTKGPKTRAFYQNILDPADPDPVTIDGHMFSIWHGKYLTMKSVVRMGFNYSQVAGEFRAAAFLVGIVPNQLQAILWFTWKRIHQVVYSPQLNLFAPEDNWGLLPNVSELKPFPLKDDRAYVQSL